jgi:prophage regulatory protein
MTKSPRFVRIRELSTILPISKASIWRKVKNGTFPKPVKLSEGITAWDMDDIESYISSAKGA